MCRVEKRCRRKCAVAGSSLPSSSVLLSGSPMWRLYTHFSNRSRIGRGEEIEMSRRVNNVTRRFFIQEVCTADRRPHARNSEQRLRPAGRFSPTATWPLPPLSQLEREREKIAVPTQFCIDAPSTVRYYKLTNYRRRYGRP